MSFAKFVLLFAIVSAALLVGYLYGQSSRTIIAQTEKQTVEKPQICDLMAKLKEEKIREIQVWNNQDKDFYGIIRHVNEPPSEDSSFKTSEKFTIYDEKGKSIYELKDLSVGDIRLERFLKSDSWEIMIETNSGGTDDFLKILAYKDGKFSEIIDESETQLRGGYFTILQYRTGMEDPYFKPSQLIVIQQIGGIDTNPSASVFRTKDKKFQKVGEIKMRELGDFIEQQISKK
jgi:hypothetical protein